MIIETHACLRELTNCHARTSVLPFAFFTNFTTWRHNSSARSHRDSNLDCSHHSCLCCILYGLLHSCHRVHMHLWLQVCLHRRCIVSGAWGCRRIGGVDWRSLLGIHGLRCIGHLMLGWVRCLTPISLQMHQLNLCRTPGNLIKQEAV